MTDTKAIISKTLSCIILKILSPLQLTGPIFDKELRVSSRRRRNFVIRFAYVILLALFLILVWIGPMRQGGSSVYRISRMAEAGQQVTIYLVWFQFCVTQVLAVIFLSNSISDEIYNRTLGLLMTTPISSFQIVIGKLLSKLLQLVLLLAISLPLLAIIRVLGGVPWNYVNSSLCITLTSIIFVGSLSLFFSIFTRRTYIVIIMTILVIGFVFGLLPFLCAWILHVLELDRVISEKILAGVIFTPNPYITMFINTLKMIEPRATAGMPTYLWPLNCLVMLVASTLLLLVSIIIVRKVALAQATGQLNSTKSKRRFRRASKNTESGKIVTGSIRRVVGPPIIWKELKAPLLGYHKILKFIFTFLVLTLLSTTYYICASENTFDDEETHLVYTIIFLAVGMLFTIILPATSITTERESRSWPVLLASPLEDKDILIGKFIGILRRCSPAWVFLFGHIMAFYIAGFIHPVAIIQTGILVTWIVIFLSFSGLYFSARFKHTTTAVLMNFALVITIWAIFPLLMAIIASINTPISREFRDLVELYLDTNPFVHMGNIIVATTGKSRGHIDNYYWPGHGNLNFIESTIWMLACMGGYITIGLLFAWRAKCQFRRKIF